jgi:hypothetical protein
MRTRQAERITNHITMKNSPHSLKTTTFLAMNRPTSIYGSDPLENVPPLKSNKALLPGEPRTSVLTALELHTSRILSDFQARFDRIEMNQMALMKKMEAQEELLLKLNQKLLEEQQAAVHRHYHHDPAPASSGILQVGDAKVLTTFRYGPPAQGVLPKFNAVMSELKHKQEA